MQRLRPKLSPELSACARAHVLDVLAMVILYVGASILAGRVWRFPFDDELIALAPIERIHSAIGLVVHYLKGGDIHPPLSFLLFYGLYHAGLSEAGIRLCSLAMTAVSLAIFQLLALMLAARRDGVPLSTRLIAVLLFGLAPLAVSQGDAIRWYPMFAMLIAMFVVLYVAADNDVARFCSAIPLGLAASTNFLAVIVLLPLALYRYALQRRFRAPLDLGFALTALIFGGMGLVSAYSIYTMRLRGVMHTEFGHGLVQAILTNVLGFFGGDALGVSQGWIIVPTVIISAVAIVSVIDRKQPDDPAHLLLLMLAATVLMVLPGFAKPRSFLYLAPAMAAVLTIFFDRQILLRGVGAVPLLASLIVVANVGAIANVNGGTHPFKRNSVIPYRNIIDFIQSNESGYTAIASTDPVVVWVLQHQHGRQDRCVEYFLAVAKCLVSGRRYDSIFVITGHSDKPAAKRRRFDQLVGQLTAGRQKVMTFHAGLDEDAELKTRLTGVELARYILAVDLYR